MIHMTWSSPRCPLLSYFLVHSKNNSYFVVIWPIRDVELTCIFEMFFPSVGCIEDRSQCYKIFFNTDLFLNVVFMTLNYFLCPILVQNPQKCTFWRYISIYPASTHSNKQHHHLMILPLYHLHTADIDRRGYIRGRTILVREIMTMI